MGLALWPKKERRKISGLDAKYKSSREIPTKPPGPWMRKRRELLELRRRLACRLSQSFFTTRRRRRWWRRRLREEESCRIQFQGADPFTYPIWWVLSLLSPTSSLLFSFNFRYSLSSLQNLINKAIIFFFCWLVMYFVYAESRGRTMYFGFISTTWWRYFVCSFFFPPLSNT